MTWPETQAALKEARVGIIVIGATEQHGPALASGTDYRIADAIAERVTEGSDGLALMAPPICVGFSPHHMDFPGTLTARVSTLAALLDDYLDSLERHGLRRFLIVNGHGGNVAFLPSYMAEYRTRTGNLIALVHWSMMGRDVVVEIAKSSVYGHACEVETSLAMALVPDVVRHEELGGPAPLNESSKLLAGLVIPERAVGGFSPRSFLEFTRNGALGDPRHADEAGGQRLADAVCSRSVDLVRFLADSPLPGEYVAAHQPDAAWGSHQPDAAWG